MFVSIGGKKNNFITPTLFSLKDWSSIILLLSITFSELIRFWTLFLDIFSNLLEIKESNLFPKSLLLTEIVI